MYNKIKINIKKSEINIFLIGSIIYFFLAYLLYKVMPSENCSTVVFYIGVITWAVFFAFLADVFYNISWLSKLFWIFSFIGIFLLLAFRNYSGIDDHTYSKIFYIIKDIGPVKYFINTTTEPGYLLLNYVVSKFTNDYMYMQMISVFIPLFLFYKVFYEEHYCLPLSVFLFITLWVFQVLSHGLVRMFFAGGIVFYAIRYLNEQKPKKYILSILIASLFHYSSLFFLIFIYFGMKNVNAKMRKKITFLSFIIMPIIFVLIAKMIVPHLGSRYNKYLDISQLSININYFDTLPIIIYIIYQGKNIREKILRNKFLIYSAIYSFSVIISISSSLVKLGRIDIHIKLLLFILFPLIYKKGINKLTTAILIIAYGFLYLYYSEFIQTLTFDFLFPYRNLFFSI